MANKVALLDVVLKGDINIALLLIKHGTSTISQNSDGETLFEILNNIILHIDNKKRLNNQYLLSKLDDNVDYIDILEQLLQNNKEDLSYFDSKGNPLFFQPLFYDHYQLFKLYIKYGLNIHANNISGNNILFEYIYHVFKNDNTNIDFANNISMLLSSKLNHNHQDKDGYTIVHKILETKCNMELFNILTTIVRFDYTITDEIGRSAIHIAVWHNHIEAIKRIDYFDKNIKNITDNHGILPITYAVLLGNYNMVLLLIELNSNIKSDITISQNAVIQLTPLFENIKIFNVKINNPDIKRKIDILIDQVKRDFKINNI